MTVPKLWELWRKFWFEPQSPTPVALFRIFFGLLLLQSTLIHVGPDLFLWYGAHGPLPIEAIKSYWWWNQPHFDLFLLLPPTNQGVLIFFSIFVLACVFLTLGLFTRYAAIIVSLALVSMHNHQPFNINGGDSMLRLYSLYLVFSEAGAAISLDRLIKRFKHPTFGEESLPMPVAPWGQRMIQVQMSLAYWQTFCHKISGTQWLDGTAVYYAVRLDDMMRYSLPFVYDNLFMCKILTWFTLVIEFALFTFVWYKDLRYVVLLGGLLLHLGIEYSLNLPVFEWAFMIGYVTFVYPEDLAKCMDRIKARINSICGPSSRLVYDQQESRQVALASVLEGLDIFGRLSIAGGRGLMTVETIHGSLNGWRLFAFLTARLPLLWILFPVFGLPTMLMSKRT
jgi:hypothetical protein